VARSPASTCHCPLWSDLHNQKRTVWRVVQVIGFLPVLMRPARTFVLIFMLLSSRIRLSQLEKNGMAAIAGDWLLDRAEGAGADVRLDLHVTLLTKRVRIARHSTGPMPEEFRCPRLRHCIPPIDREAARIEFDGDAEQILQLVDQIGLAGGVISLHEVVDIEIRRAQGPVGLLAAK
jgi:hypothetical protein